MQQQRRLEKPKQVKRLRRQWAFNNPPENYPEPPPPVYKPLG